MLGEILLLVQDDRLHFLDVVQPLRPFAGPDAQDAADDLGKPWISSSVPAIGISALSGNTGMPAGLKMLTTLKRIDIAA